MKNANKKLNLPLLNNYLQDEKKVEKMFSPKQFLTLEIFSHTA